MKSFKIVIALAMFTTGVSQAAVFKVFNQTNNIIQVFSPVASAGLQITSLKPGQSEEYNTVLNDVNQIRWTEVTMQDSKSLQLPPTYVANVRLGKLNIGGRFQIFPNGAYTYDFGVDGRGQNTGQRVQ